MTNNTSVIMLAVSIVLLLLFFVVIFLIVRKRLALKDKCTFTITTEGLEEQSEKIRKILSKMGSTKQEIASSLLLLEEIIVRMQESSESAMTVRVSKFLSDTKISLSVFGKPFNPFIYDSNLSEGDEDFYRNLIFRANESNLSYGRRSGKNVMTITVHSGGNRAMYLTFASMILGIVFGFILKYIPQNVSNFISDNILTTVQSIFMNVLSFILAPIVFFSIVTSFSRMSGGSEIGRIGGKILGMYLFTSVLAIVFAILFSFIFFVPGFSIGQLDALNFDSSSISTLSDVSVAKLLIDLVPKNLVSPILTGNMLQIILVAVFVGLVLSSLGDKVSNLNKIIHELNSVVLRFMMMILYLLPIVAFASMGILIFKSDAKSLLLLLNLIIALFVVQVFNFFVQFLLVVIFSHNSPFTYLKKVLQYLVTPFTVSSSSACIPMTMNFCKEKLGISDKVSSFAIPIGASINMNGSCIALTLCSIMIAKICGLELDAMSYLKIGVLVLVIAIGTPAMPGASLVSLATVLSLIGAPISFVTLLIGIWNIVDRLDTMFNVSGDISAAFVVSSTEKDLNMEIYKKK